MGSPPPGSKRLVRRARPRLGLALVEGTAWGGRRAGAGRKPTVEPAISHRRALAMREATPVHVTIRVRDDVPSLRTPACHGIVAVALRAIRYRPDFGVVHFSIQTTHLHLIAEACDADALARGMAALSGRIALGMNRLTKRVGRLFAQDRYHAHVLRTPTEVANAVAYVLGNFASHSRRRGQPVPAGFVDPYSSAEEYGPDGCRPPVAEARSWLLRTRGGFVREAEVAYGVAA